jgi:S1-C subfamily serine protease
MNLDDTHVDGPENEAPPVLDVSAKGEHRISGASLVALAAAISLAVSLVVGLGAGYLGARLASTTQRSLAPTSRVKVMVPATAEPVQAAAAAAVPSIVYIEVRSTETSGGSGGLPKAHPSVPVVDSGSGVAYKEAPDGGTYILTNNHVVKDARRLTVRDATGKSYQAALVGRDAESDMAVVKVDAAIPTINLGDSSKLAVGQTVVAIGSPFGLEHSVTSGVVSALGRSLPDFAEDDDGTYPLVDVIQTDAAINPGNSGGALVDRQGRLVGINTAIYSDSGASGGIGFAIPSDSAIRVAEKLIAGGKVDYPFLGIIGMTVTPELAADKKLPVEEGAFVSELAKGSGSEKAGLKAGDIVVELGGEPVRSMDELILLVRRHEVGDTIKLVVLRGGKRVDFQVTAGAKPKGIKPSAPTTSGAETTPSKP